MAVDSAHRGRDATCPEGSAVPGGERLQRSERLTHRLEFQHCYRRGRRVHRRLLTVHYVPGEGDVARIGMTLPRKVGSAVRRNRARRRLREAYRRSSVRAQLPSVDFVVHLRPGSGDASGDALRRDLFSALEEVRTGRRRPKGDRRSRSS